MLVLIGGIRIYLVFWKRRTSDSDSIGVINYREYRFGGCTLCIFTKHAQTIDMQGNANAVLCTKLSAAADACGDKP
jgi:hypothetical protein